MAPGFEVTTPQDGVAVITMDDGKVNAIGPEFLTGFRAAWQEAGANDRAIVLAGRPNVFSAGLNLKHLPTLERSELVAFFVDFMGMLHDVYGHLRPTVAAVNGGALAGGAFLARGCDARIAGPDVKIGFTEVPVGIPFPPPLVPIAGRGLPAQEERAAVLEGVVRVGDDALQKGWVDAITTPDRLVGAAVARAAELGALPPRAFAGTKAAMNADSVAAIASFDKESADRYVDELMHDETVAAILTYMQRVTAKK